MSKVAKNDNFREVLICKYGYFALQHSISENKDSLVVDVVVVVVFAVVVVVVVDVFVAPFLHNGGFPQLFGLFG